ncbi:cytochrome c oxidase assembly protein [Salinisphaera sp. Q1T1-3]|uniref:cytochrome c oxidase assembly protein n=1 Tax=Salinisphaera sp. Q1T1-3 TaxID=2321229 RepID=UPI000E754694|nr:cytochrome c oxidase assembly protein [Salinisphaera sp. Q1T1-3]RJS94286.1 cytochrome c oxidase assembly protein [Salinisphaera sp. Q1T1-3]
MTEAPLAPAAASPADFLDPAHRLWWLLALYGFIALIYARGLWRRRRTADVLPALAFFAGLAGLYLFTQTGLDTLGRRLFYVHRLQHLVLHHLAPFLIALAAPSAVLVSGLPAAARLARRLRRLPRRWVAPVIAGYRAIQQPVLGALLFVGLIALWLTPAVHHLAMASGFGYWLMNLSMAIEGLAFWWFMLDRRLPGSHPTTHGIGTRIVVLWAVMPPQIAIGAFITLAPVGLYPGYGPAEQAYGISPGVDQQVGGLLTWIPPAMMSLVGTLVLMRFGFVQHRDRSRPGVRHGDPDRAGNPTSGE